MTMRSGLIGQDKCEAAPAEKLDYFATVLNFTKLQVIEKRQTKRLLVCFTWYLLGLNDPITK